MPPKPGHVSRWPAFPPRPSSRRLAYLSGDTIVTSDGEIVGRPESWEEWLELTTGGEHSFIVLAEELGRSPWVRRALEHPESGSVDCKKDGGILAVRCRGKRNRTSVMVDRNVWSKELDAPELLHELELLFIHHQSGPQTTPGALGSWGMSAAYSESHRPRSRPSVFLRKALLDNGTGGLVATPGLGGRFAQLWEIDRRSAYAAEAAGELPADTPIRIIKGHSERAAEYPMWYCACIVYLPHELPLPLFGSPNGPNSVYRPTGRGWYGGHASDYKVWLWSVEAEALRTRVGARVYPLEGWGWERTERPLSTWAYRMWELRQKAPSPQVAKWTKASMVAAVGRLGVHPVRYQLGLAKEHPDGLPVLVQSWPPITEYVVVETPNMESPSPTDWHSLILARARVTLWNRALDEIEQGNTVYSIDHDSVVMDHASRLKLAPEELGEWKQTVLHKVHIPKARQIVSDEVTRLPGVPLASRRQSMLPVL